MISHRTFCLLTITFFTSLPRNSDGDAKIPIPFLDALNFNDPTSPDCFGPFSHHDSQHPLTSSEYNNFYGKNLGEYNDQYIKNPGAMRPRPPQRTETRQGTTDLLGELRTKRPPPQQGNMENKHRPAPPPPQAPMKAMRPPPSTPMTNSNGPLNPTQSMNVQTNAPNPAPMKARRPPPPAPMTNSNGPLNPGQSMNAQRHAPKKPDVNDNMIDLDPFSQDIDSFLAKPAPKSNFNPNPPAQNKTLDLSGYIWPE